MPLPFLSSKKQSSPAAAEVTRNPAAQPNEGLHMAASDLIDAIHARDIASVAQALKAAFELADSEPHVEGPHTNESNE